jgi:hypothetical protein
MGHENPGLQFRVRTFPGEEMREFVEGLMLKKRIRQGVRLSQESIEGFKLKRIEVSLVLRGDGPDLKRRGESLQSPCTQFLRCHGIDRELPGFKGKGSVQDEGGKQQEQYKDGEQNFFQNGMN